MECKKPQRMPGLLKIRWNYDALTEFHGREHYHITKAKHPLHGTQRDKAVTFPVTKRVTFHTLET
mgnify:FL=1